MVYWNPEPERAVWKDHLGGGLVTSGPKGQSAQSDLTGRESGEGIPLPHSLLSCTCEEVNQRQLFNLSKSYFSHL